MQHFAMCGTQLCGVCFLAYMSPQTIEYLSTNMLSLCGLISNQHLPDHLLPSCFPAPASGTLISVAAVKAAMQACLATRSQL